MTDLTPDERLAAAEDRSRRQRVNLRGPNADHTLSFSRRSNGRVSVSLEPDSPLTYGYEEAGTVLGEQELQRLAYWLIMGVALDRDAEVPALGLVQP